MRSDCLENRRGKKLRWRMGGTQANRDPELLKTGVGGQGSFWGGGPRGMEPPHCPTPSGAELLKGARGGGGAVHTSNVHAHLSPGKSYPTTFAPTPTPPPPWRPPSRRPCSPKAWQPWTKGRDPPGQTSFFRGGGREGQRFEAPTQTTKDEGTHPDPPPLKHFRGGGGVEALSQG